jgi:hypothetical protein
LVTVPLRVAVPPLAPVPVWVLLQVPFEHDVEPWLDTVCPFGPVALCVDEQVPFEQLPDPEWVAVLPFDPVTPPLLVQAAAPCTETASRPAARTQAVRYFSINGYSDHDVGVSGVAAP